MTIQPKSETAKHPTIIPINSRWRIRADDLQWIVEHSSGQNPRWRGVRFFRSLDQAAISVLHSHLKEGRLREVPEGWTQALQELMHRVDAAKEEIAKAVSEWAQK